MEKVRPNICLFILALLFVFIPSLEARSSGENPPSAKQADIKKQVEVFIKDFVSDIAHVAAEVVQQAKIPQAPSQKSATSPRQVSSKTNTTDMPSTAFGAAPVQADALAIASPEIIVLNNILYISGEPMTKSRLSQLERSGVPIDKGLFVYAPDRLPPHVLPLNSKNQAHTLLTKPSLSPFEYMANNNDKVLLADVYGEAIPCHAHYDAQWDVSRIHPYRYDLSKMPQSVVFMLSNGIDRDFVMPVEGDVEVTSGFGPRWGRHHNGIDLDLDTGDEVMAAFDGKVRIAQYSSSYGNVVVIRHFNGLETIYAHLSRLLVSPNQEVNAGTVIGLGGTTGRSTGSHLHFEVRYKGHPLNPREMIDFVQGEVKNNTFMIDRSYFSSDNPYDDVHASASSWVKRSGKKSSWSAKHKSTAKRFHTVKKGDTLSELAGKYRTSVQKICSFNKISAKTVLKTGRKLRVN